MGKTLRGMPAQKKNQKKSKQKARSRRNKIGKKKRVT